MAELIETPREHDGLKCIWSAFPVDRTLPISSNWSQLTSRKLRGFAANIKHTHIIDTIKCVVLENSFRRVVFLKERLYIVIG